MDNKEEGILVLISLPVSLCSRQKTNTIRYGYGMELYPTTNEAYVVTTTDYKLLYPRTEVRAADLRILT